MVFADYHDLLNLPEVEVVIVSVPHNLHYAITLDALNAGKHVLCEKPLAMNMEQGQEMIALAQEKGLILGTFFQNRFFDASQKAERNHTERRNRPNSPRPMQCIVVSRSRILRYFSMAR